MSAIEKNYYKNLRNSNIEFLRFLSMLMIIAYHYSIYGFYAEDIIHTANKYFVDIFGMFGKVGTDIFVLITGYYMVKSRLTAKKLLELMGQIWFYTLGILLAVILSLGPSAADLSMIKLSVLPITNSHYWFVSYYVLLMLISPFINVLLHSISRQMHAVLCLLLFALTTFLPEFLHISFLPGSLPLFVALYVCAGYIRLHLNTAGKNRTRSLVITVLLILLCILRIVITDRIWQNTGNSAGLETSVNFMGAYSPFAFCIAIALLVWVVGLKPANSKLAFLLGSSSFGVYLLHENIFVNSRIWQDLFHTAEQASSPKLFMHAFLVVALIYTAGFFTEFIRKKTFAPIWSKLVNKLSPIIETTFERLVVLSVKLIHTLF